VEGAVEGAKTEAADAAAEGAQKATDEIKKKGSSG